MSDRTILGKLPAGTRTGMHCKTRLQRVLAYPDIYDVDVGRGCAIIRPPDMDAVELHRIRESVDLEVYYIREDGIRITMTE